MHQGLSKSVLRMSIRPLVMILCQLLCLSIWLKKEGVCVCVKKKRHYFCYFPEFSDFALEWQYEEVRFCPDFREFWKFFWKSGQIWFLLNLLSTISNFSLKTKIPKISFFRNHVWAHLSKTHWTFLYKTTTLASQSPEKCHNLVKFRNCTFERFATHF